MNERQRTQDRAQIVAHGRFRTESGQAGNATFADISERGCRLFDPSRLLKPGDGVTIWIEKVGPFAASVQWREHGEVGVKFIRPLYAPVFEHLKSQLAWKDATRGRGSI